MLDRPQCILDAARHRPGQQPPHVQGEHVGQDGEPLRDQLPRPQVRERVVDLLKDTPPADLLAAIRVVAAGEALLAPSVTRRLIAEFTRVPAVPAAPVGLDGVTEREREVLTLVARGQSNAEIATHLHLGLPTVKTHIGRLLSKLAARDRAQLVIVAYETGLVSPATRR